MTEQTSTSVVSTPKKGMSNWLKVLIGLLVFGLATLCCGAIAFGTYQLGSNRAESKVVLAVTNTPVPTATVAPEPTLAPEPTKAPEPTATAQPTQVPTAVLSNKTCQGTCWKINQDNKLITWTGPVDGTEDIWTADEFEKLIESGWSAEIPNTQVPWRLEVCNTGTSTSPTALTVDGKAVTLPEIGECTSTLTVDKGSLMLSNNPSPAGGFRFSPQMGYGWNK